MITYFGKRAIDGRAGAMVESMCCTRNIVVLHVHELSSVMIFVLPTEVWARPEEEKRGSSAAKDMRQAGGRAAAGHTMQQGNHLTHACRQTLGFMHGSVNFHLCGRRERGAWAPGCGCVYCIVCMQCHGKMSRSNSLTRRRS